MIVAQWRDVSYLGKSIITLSNNGYLRVGLFHGQHIPINIDDN